MSISITDQPIAEKISLTVESEDAGTELFLIDGKFQLMERAVGRLQMEVVPGIYKVKCRTGAVTSEQLVLVEKEAVVMRLPRLSFSSPAPLNDTAKFNESHANAAKIESNKIHIRYGTGSRLFIFVRDWDFVNEPVILPYEESGIDNPAKWLSLYHESGIHIADIDRTGVHGNHPGDKWAACSLEVQPGTYRLRLNIPDRNGGHRISLEQAIVASPGWQTQVFLLRKEYGPKVEDRAADLGGAAILLSRGGFDSSQDDFRQTELARLALTNRRQLISEEILRMLNAKMENPMLGILGAHLLMLRPNFNRELLGQVVQNLRNLLRAPHPDVEAIALQLAGGSTFAFDSPPLLRRSWSLIVQGTTVGSAVIRPNSLAAAIWNRLCSDEPWLLWTVPQNIAQDSKGSAVQSRLETEHAELATLREFLEPTTQLQFEPTRSPFAAVRRMHVESQLSELKVSMAESKTDPPRSQGSSWDDKIKILAEKLEIPEETLRTALNKT
jgi:hypothetical protein